MPTPLQSDYVVPDLVLQAARAAIPANVAELMPLPDCGELNRPLLPLLVALLEAAEITARAIADNAWDGGQPLCREFAQSLVTYADQIQMHLANAAHAPIA